MKQNPFVTNGNNKTRFAVLIVGLILVLLTVFFGTFLFSGKYAEAEVLYWTNAAYRASDFAGGDGTADNPYKITNAKELALMAYRVNNGEKNPAGKSYSESRYQLENNVSLVAPDKNGNQLVWEPIGAKGVFSGTFDGGGHTINGLYISQTTSDYAGLFGCVGVGVGGSNGKVCNLRVEGTILLKSGKKYVGGVIARVYVGSDDAVKLLYTPASKLSSNVNILLNGDATDSYLGGIIGQCFDDQDGGHLTIEECFSMGTIIKKDYVFGGNCPQVAGGIVGGVEGGIGVGVTVYIQNCINKCEILHSTNTKSVVAGGIVGESSSSLSIKNCYNTADVDSGYSGGIVGECSSYFTKSLEVVNCYNTGNITASLSYNGGIVAKIWDCSLKIQYCYNTGKIQGGNASGGIVGLADELTPSSKIENCYNQGKVCAALLTGGSAGGIAGDYSSSSENFLASISYCHNNGQIEGSSHAAGIVAFCANTKIEQCKNKEYVVVNQNQNLDGFISRVGGIAGYAYNTSIKNCENEAMIGTKKYRNDVTGGIVGEMSTSSVEYCHNNYYGYVYGKQYTGGIVGICKEDCKVTDSLNRGDTNGTKCIGGIVGSCEKSSLVSGCMNIGVISGGQESLGGIAGRLNNGGGNRVNYCINYGKVDSSGEGKPDENGVGGIVGYMEKGAGSITNDLNAGIMVYNSSRYVGQVVGRNVKNKNVNSDCYYVSEVDRKAFGTSGDGTASSSGKPTAVSVRKLGDTSFSASYWEKYTVDFLYPNSYTNNFAGNAIINAIENGALKGKDGLQNGNTIIFPKFKIAVTTNDFKFKDKASSVWGFDNPHINDGDPYFKDRYW